VGSSELPPSTGARRTAWLFVAAQFVLLAFVILLPHADAWPVSSTLGRICQVTGVVGIGVMVVGAVGLGRGLTAAPLPNEHARLRTGGLYGVVRHPIYSGLLLFTLAQVVASANIATAVAGALLVVLINGKARWEEDRLTERFPDYPAYARRIGRFVPRLRMRGTTRDS